MSHFSPHTHPSSPGKPPNLPPEQNTLYDSCPECPEHPKQVNDLYNARDKRKSYVPNVPNIPGKERKKQNHVPCPRRPNISWPHQLYVPAAKFQRQQRFNAISVLSNLPIVITSWYITGRNIWDSEEEINSMPSDGNKRVTKTHQPPFIANPQQAAAIAHTNGPAAFIAAAGTGKTSILVQRLVRLIADEGIDPASILCVTFTRAAANEMEKRALKALKVRGISAEKVKALRVVTFHGLGHQLLREKLQWAPQELNQRLISGEPRQWLAEDILRPWRSNRTRGMNWEVDILDVLSAVDRAKEAMVGTEESEAFFRSHLGIDTELAERYREFYSQYEQSKQKEKLYDLSDLIYVPLKLLGSSPKFRKTWQERYQYLQVDETQDTNPSQYQLISYLAAPHHNVVVVGDPDQAIYQFRGASPEASILSFRSMYPKGTIYHIESNYRSTPQILEAANRLIGHNETTPGFEKVLRATHPDGAPVHVTAYEDQESEANGIATQIATLVRSWREAQEKLSYHDIFVLSRTNHHLARLEIALAHNNIPYHTIGGSSFFKRRTTRDMLPTWHLYRV